MKIIHYSKAVPKYFEGDAVKGVTGRVAIGKADGAENFCMRVFELSENGFSPKHSHEWEHEIFIHSGKGEAFYEDKWHPIQVKEKHFMKINGILLKLVMCCSFPAIKFIRYAIPAQKNLFLSV